MDKNINSQKRLGVLGIFIEKRESVALVNNILSDFSHCIKGRIGIPEVNQEWSVNVISVIISGTTDDLGSLSGKLGQIPGVEVKSLMSKKSKI